MKTANILLHHSPYYRVHVFSEGLKKHGYRIIQDRNATPSTNDLLLLWNRNPPHELIAKKYENCNAKVLITENGFLGKSKALALNHHSGAGTWHVGNEDRWKALAIELKPWRKKGDHILVLPQRSIGELGVAMPRNWEMSILPKLKEATERPIRVRKHPGKNANIPIEQDLDNAWAVVTWASGAGIKAICNGIPVFHQLSKWIGAQAATTTLDIENPWMGDRLPMLKRLAWAQWSWQEIESGEAFKCLL